MVRHVSIYRLDGHANSNSKLVGDAVYAGTAEQAVTTAAVPGREGLMNIALLMANPSSWSAARRIGRVPLEGYN